MNRLRYPACLFFLATLLFYSRLGCPLLEPEEARYAEIPRQMLVKGSWLVPVLHGEDYLQKPPLLYWLIMLSYQVFGVHDWAARLVPSTAGVLTVLLTFFWGQRAVGIRGGFAGAAILCLSGQFLYLGGMVGMDALLCLWVVGGLACGHLALVKRPAGLRKTVVLAVRELKPLSPGVPRERGDFATQSLATQSLMTRSSINGWWLASALCCGLGVMTKGPVAAVLIIAPILAWRLLEKRARRIGFGSWSIYSGIVLLVAGPWFGAISVRAPEATGSFFWLHNVIRYLTPFDHEKPAWFYLPGLFLGMFPWSLLIVPLSVCLFRGRRLWARRQPPQLGFFVIASLWSLVFFSMSGCKRTAYILPAFPCLALALGTFASRAFAVIHWARPAWRSIGGVTAAILVMACFFLLPAYHRKFALRAEMEEVANLPPDVSVVCYPRRWDSVSFYLGREVECFTRENRDQLVGRLGRCAMLILFKKEAKIAEVMEGLPANVEWVPSARDGRNIGAGVIKRKDQ